MRTWQVYFPRCLLKMATDAHVRRDSGCSIKCVVFRGCSVARYVVYTK